MDEQWPSNEVFGDNDSSAELNYVSWTKLASALFLSSCCLVGLYGNILSIFIFSRPSMKSSINFLLTALSFTDAMLLISVFFVLILPNFNVAYPTQAVTTFYPYIILILYPISTMTQTCSVWTFVLVSVERYVAICHPLKRHKLLTLTEAKLAQFLVFACGISYNAIRFWEYKLIPSRVESSNRRNDTGDDNDDIETFELVDYLRANSYYFLYYSTVMHICTHFLFPFTIILAAHLSVFRALKRARKQIRNHHVRNHRGRHRGTTFMIMTLTLAFVFFNVLPLVGDLWESLDSQLYEGPWMRSGQAVSELANCLSVLNSSCTFFIYLMYCKKYRRLFAKYSCFGSTPDKLPVSHNESQCSFAYL